MLIRPQDPIMEGLTVINRGAIGVALVTDDDMRLVGIVTDGDIRRGLLRHVSLEAPVAEIMGQRPITARDSDSRDHILALMRAHELDHIPIVNADGALVGLERLQQLARPVQRDNWVVLMAGGLGSRLGALTRDCPKPLLQVGSQPILEVILESYIALGFHRFFLSVNYKKHMIQDYFGHGERWGVRIDYLEEKEPLGTAGPLGLLPDRPTSPLIVMNGDLLTRLDFTRVLDFHREHEAEATLCVRQVEETVPYGVVQLENGHRLSGIHEKPVNKYFVNTGIYVLEPSALERIPAGGYLDMPDLFRQLIDSGRPTAAFPFLEYWMDIGQVGDFHQARKDYEDLFP
ncbi:putative nucleotidyl transferase [Magnetofaba australis IT-1]|uniref:Putative nucleotidyl transferase n=1 Tax=Magnetofaba australis IT-1 TaxID=1434232 RepID=A0A1Y2K2J3_9PROT|nr:putative nucleotidyl transferase [Magnetofaba australis IT-1]